MFASSHTPRHGEWPQSWRVGDVRARAEPPCSTARSSTPGSLVTSRRLSVLEQLEKSIKQDRPWEKVTRARATRSARSQRRSGADGIWGHADARRSLGPRRTSPSRQKKPRGSSPPSPRPISARTKLIDLSVSSGIAACTHACNEPDSLSWRIAKNGKQLHARSPKRPCGTMVTTCTKLHPRAGGLAPARRREPPARATPVRDGAEKFEATLIKPQALNPLNPKP